MNWRSQNFRPGGSGGIGLDLSPTPWVKRLLIANTAIFLAMVVGLLPARWAIEMFGFSVAEWIRHPWSPITYMFIHGGGWHLFFNMLVLFFFGPPLERKWGGPYFIRYYLVAGVGGALFSLLLFALVGPSLVIGASGAIYGLLLAFALNWPNAPIYIMGVFPVPAKWFVTALGVFALLGTTGGRGDGVAHWAHIGGLATGFVFLRYGDRIGRATSKLIWKEKPSHVKVEPKTPRRSEPVAERRRRRDVGSDALDEVDRVLDKIRSDGIDSLTPEERSFLDDMSRRYQRTSNETMH